MRTSLNQNSYPPWGLQQHPSAFRHRTNQPTPIRGSNLRGVRWYNTGTQGGGGTNGGKGSGPGKPPEGGGGNFFQNLVENIRKSLKGSEVQESLKGFNEEREKMQQSYVIQQAKLKWSALMEKLGGATSTSAETASKGWSTIKKTSTKAS